MEHRLLFEVRHLTNYIYSAPVFLEPHVVRLKPFTDAGQRLERFSLRVHPVPAGMNEVLEFEGNAATICWFDGMTPGLSIETKAVVATSRPNPFEYLSTGRAHLPYRYGAGIASESAPYATPTGHADVVRLSEQIAAGVGSDANAFLPATAEAVRRRCRLIIRPEGDPMPSWQTLALGEGSCRDLAVVFMDLCRSQGFAARFVSGYRAVLGEGEQDLHAWAEAYLDGGGWRGFDPTAGLAVGEDHIAIARAAHPLNAAPVTGSYRGSAEATLESIVTITLHDGPGTP